MGSTTDRGGESRGKSWATTRKRTIYLPRAFFAQIPSELEEAARIDGGGDREIRVTHSPWVA